MVTDGYCNEEDVTTLVKNYVEKAKLKRRHGHELTYTLPVNETHRFSGNILF